MQRQKNRIEAGISDIKKNTSLTLPLYAGLIGFLRICLSIFNTHVFSHCIQRVA